MWKVPNNFEFWKHFIYFSHFGKSLWNILFSKHAEYLFSSCRIVDYFHRINKKQKLQLLEPWICSMCSRNSKVVRICCALMYGTFSTTYAWDQCHQPRTTSKLKKKLIWRIYIPLLCKVWSNKWGLLWPDQFLYL